VSQFIVSLHCIDPDARTGQRVPHPASWVVPVHQFHLDESTQADAQEQFGLLSLNRTSPQPRRWWCTSTRTAVDRGPGSAVRHLRRHQELLDAHSLLQPDLVFPCEASALVVCNGRRGCMMLFFFLYVICKGRSTGKHTAEECENHQPPATQSRCA
jgi:hypothetical protein